MVTFNNWQEAFKSQQAGKHYSDNSFSSNIKTGIEVIDGLPFALGSVVWVIMAPNYYLDDYEESATEYGITEDGRWAAIHDGHCSCYGWEADERSITYYDSLDLLLAADPNAAVIINHIDILRSIYPFINYRNDQGQP